MDNYFHGGGRVEKTLRFLNLLEPGGNMVLSLSKLFLWIMMWAFVFLVIFSPGNLFALAPTGAGLLGALSNYAYRRKKQYEAGQLPYPAHAPAKTPVPEDHPPPHVMPKLDGNQPT